MGEIRDKLTAMEIRVTSPDGGIEGVLKGGRKGMISFFQDNYYRYSEDALAHQLEALLRLWVVGQRRGRVQALTEAGRNVSDHDVPHWNRRIREMKLAVLDAEAEGLSTGEFIRIDSVGLREFEVSFGEGALDELSEEEFVSEFSSAVTDLISDWRMVTEHMRQKALEG